MHTLPVDKDEALIEFRNAQRLAPDFVKNFESAIEEEKEVAPILGDHAFLQKYFRKAFLRAWSVTESEKVVECLAVLAKVV